ncbi:hypothetical protein [Epilithonimonas arachidiradicis]|uniref:Uncharacterized protein n=1 Tax=Epilithonimonas arachidiradicis TaxID=1617282 RepID=A0A420D968_9FLAO|nr:hypothetical protein [Epilithonimonas arachidiradicis]RKE87178.1 hypothetical protein BXY58_2054 [Epilithonimonas arachidiradicis]
MKILITLLATFVMSSCVCDPEDRDVEKRDREMKEKAEANS